MRDGFRWICLGLAAIAVAAIVWIVYDVRSELKRVTATIDKQLPPILEKTRQSSESLAGLSEDIRQIRDLAGATAPRDQSLVAYADGVLDAIAASGGQIGVEKVIGKQLKGLRPAQEWVTGARKEALWLTVSKKSRRDLLEALCRTKFGSSWYLQFGEAEPVLLMEWVRANHAPSRDL